MLKSMIIKINILESNLFTTSVQLSVIFNRKTVDCMDEKKKLQILNTPRRFAQEKNTTGRRW